jgi:hypothetical protein
MSWIEALKARAAKTGKYVVPKKGSAEYDDVKKMMGGAAPAAAAAKAAPAKKAKAVEVLHKKEGKVLKAAVVAHAAEGAAMAAPPKAPRKPRSRKPTVDRTPMSSPDRAPKRVMKRGGATERATAASKNPEAIFESQTNEHLAGSSPAVIADITGDVKKAIVRSRKATVPIVNAKNPRDATPFSVDAVKREIGA